jgi:5'-deoxynucleotidase YfbR-like HD superfamily hydrolase
MQNFVHEMLHDSPAALKIMSLWKEYEKQTTAEARFVKGKPPLFTMCHPVFILRCLNTWIRSR